MTASDNDVGITPGGPQKEPSLFSYEKGMMDYVSLKGIKNRTGVEEHQLLVFILKELIDNALDFIDQNIGKAGPSSPEVKVAAHKAGKRLIIKVSNSNFGITVFTDDVVARIFDFSNLYSSKRNQYKISRGALGDALKEVASIPFALAESNNIEGWNQPIVIKSGTSQFLISLIVDRVKQTLGTEIRKEQVANKCELTEIEITLPAAHNLDLDIQAFLYKYIILNPHTNFEFNLSLNDEKNETNLDFEAYQASTNSWSNQSSVYYYNPSEFRNLCLGLDDNNAPAYRLLQIFREGSNVKKNCVPETIGELKRNPDQIQDVYEMLRSVMGPKDKLDVPFKVDKKQRIQALRKRVEQLGFTVSHVSYQLKQGYCKTEGIEFPFLVEAAIIQTVDLPRYMMYIEGINSSPQHYFTFLSGRPGTFEWKTRNNKIQNAASVFEMLEKYGYSYNKEKCKKPHTIVYVNLISPRIDYENYGKSDIDLNPYSNTIAHTIYKVCLASRNNGSTEHYFARDTAEGLLTELLESRLKDIENEPSLIHTDRWTQSTVYYRLRPQLIARGINVNRKYITSQIRKVCEQKLGMSRAQLGIVAADRAQLYFKGQWHDVGLDELDKLMHMGTDMLIIEKEGVAEVLSPFAEKMGIALLNTRGFLTEYATMLSNLSKKNGCNVAILTDFDVSGLLLARKVPGVYRIGIDFNTLYYFGLKRKDVEEAYSAQNNHMKPLSDMGPTDGEDENTFYRNLKYISNKRIEIDSVLARVGNEPFWEYIIHNLTKQFSRRNYNRSIYTPTFVMPDVLIEFIEKIKNKFASRLASDHQLVKEGFSNFEGIIVDVDKKVEEITNMFKAKMAKDEELQTILAKIQKLSDEI